MAVIVEWSEQAASSLEEIFGYHKKEVARKIATKITQRTRILSDNPLAGQREELLKDLSVEFRYLVEGNYKSSIMHCRKRSLFLLFSIVVRTLKRCGI